MSPRTVVPASRFSVPLMIATPSRVAAGDGGGAVDHDERIDGSCDARVTVDDDHRIGLLVGADIDVATRHEHDASGVGQLLVGGEGDAGHAERERQDGDEHEELLHLDLLRGPSTRRPAARWPSRPRFDLGLSVWLVRAAPDSAGGPPAATPNGRSEPTVRREPCVDRLGGAHAVGDSPRRPWPRRARGRHRRRRPSARSRARH